ncbi:hypothetical protein LB505_008590 [Fusarium chuoi]|nr:hypothetical protein LB505_008590 [Fusarium chuoi]
MAYLLYIITQEIVQPGSRKPISAKGHCYHQLCDLGPRAFANRGKVRCFVTIEDAITVVSEVGIQFLWIDRYCVPQQDCPQEREQIQMMHNIYRQQT